MYASNISSKSSFEDNEKVNSGITAQGPSKHETETVQIVSFYLSFSILMAQIEITTGFEITTIR